MQYVEGDLISANEPVIAHGCNALGAFGSGFAAAVRARLPEAYRSYQFAHRNGVLRLGTVVWGMHHGRIVAHCITQPTYGRSGLHLSYDALRSCMRELNAAGRDGCKEADIPGFDRIAMPLIGADRGGGDWSVISAIIAEELRDVKPVVYFLPGSGFIPPQPRFPGF